MATRELPELLRRDDVADWLGVSAQRVSRLARAGEIPAVVLPGGDLAFDRARLAEWIRARPTAGREGGQ